MIVAHVRLILDNIAKYGFIFAIFSTTSDEIQNQVVWALPKPFLALGSWLSLFLIVFSVEKLAQYEYLSDQATLIIQSIISIVNIIGSCCWVWWSNSHPVWGILYLLESVVLWMKLISYVHCNRYCYCFVLFFCFFYFYLFKQLL